jgi:hypothetical protein
MPFMLNHIVLKDVRNTQEFVDLVTELAAAVKEGAGWNLVYRLQADGGGELWHLWQVDNADQIEQGRNVMHSDPRLREIIAATSELKTSEVGHGVLSEIQV